MGTDLWILFSMRLGNTLGHDTYGAGMKHNSRGTMKKRVFIRPSHTV